MGNRDQILTWHGSKRALAPTIVSLFPADYERLLYCEPFCGSASVFWTKLVSKLEVLNDLNGDLINFLATVKFHPHELVRCFRLIPDGREIFARLLDTNCDLSSVWRAARFLLLSHTSFGGLRQHWAPRGRQSRGGVKPNHLAGLKIRIFRWAERLSRTVLECTSWQEVTEKFDSRQTLFYFDPPYPDTKAYGPRFGWPDWRELHATLAHIKGKFLLTASGWARMKLFWRGYHQRVVQTRGSLGFNRLRQKELIVWNYDRAAG